MNNHTHKYKCISGAFIHAQSIDDARVMARDYHLELIDHNYQFPLIAPALATLKQIDIVVNYGYCTREKAELMTRKHIGKIIADLLRGRIQKLDQVKIR